MSTLHWNMGEENTKRRKIHNPRKGEDTKKEERNRDKKKNIDILSDMI